jgi:hypothetical protein
MEALGNRNPRETWGNKEPFTLIIHDPNICDVKSLNLGKALSLIEDRNVNFFSLKEEELGDEKVRSVGV